MSVKHDTFRLSITLLGVGTIACLAFAFFLGHRNDYVGHFAAGFGGTLGLLTVVIATLGEASAPSRLSTIALNVAIVSIGVGAIFEATVFRIAQFDIVDFCNQSTGAVLAVLAFIAARPLTPLHISSVSVGLTTASAFLIAGFILAFS